MALPLLDEKQGKRLINKQDQENENAQQNAQEGCDIKPPHPLAWSFGFKKTLSGKKAHIQKSYKGDKHMECRKKIEIKEPDKNSLPFHPILQFQFEQLNLSAECMNENEIDEQINQLIYHVEQLRNEAKIKLNTSIKKHDKLYKRKAK